jgi:hypothetical protein
VSTESKTDRPVTPTEAVLVLIYILFALARQVTHDVRSIFRWLTPS